MSNNSFMLNIIATLNKQLSKVQLKNDLKGINNTLSVKVIAKLTTALSKKQLANSLKQINNLYVQVGAKFKTDNSSKKKMMGEIEQLQKKLGELQIKVNTNKAASANTVKSVVSTVKMAQQYADKTSITLDVEIRKEKAVNDILYIGQKYSKLFSNISASQKYENLLNSAYSISDKIQLQEVRMQIAAFTSELKANGLAVQSTGDKWKKLIDRSKELFSAAAVVRMIFTQVKQAVSTTIDLDKTYTDLVKVNDELNRNDYADYLSKINKKAQELAATQKALIEGATEFSKSGYDLSTSDALTEKSTILSNVGDMSASDSAKAIISGVQAYDVVDGYTDVINKAQALIDKYNEIGNSASISTAEIAQGVQKVGSVFSDANTSVDEFIALLSAGNRQFQDADNLSLALRTAALRIRGCSAELEAMGEETDNVYTSASKLAEKIAGLTNVNGTGGVKILEDDGETFRSIYKIFLDISKVYKDMSDTDASALLELIAGKNRASAISATLNNMTEAEEILQNSINAAGSAQKEYDAYLESTEAHIQKFQAALVETYSTFMNGDMVSHAADIGTAVLDLVNSTDLLKHSILAVLALNVGKGITNIGAAIAVTSKQMNTLGSALQQIKNLPNDKVLRKESLQELGKETLSLTEKNLKLLLSQNKLEDSDKIRILRAQDLSKEEAKAKLEKMGLLTVTNQQTTANVAEAATTGTLKNAMLSLKASAIGTGNALKAAFLSNPIGIALTAITTIISVATTAITKHNEKLEETRRANLESAATASENADKLKDLYTEYTRLASIQNRTVSEEESFKTAVENITAALGNKAKALEGLTAGTDEYADALANATKEELQNQAVDATVGRKSAEEELRETVFNRWSGSKVTIDSEALSEDAKRAVDIVSGILKGYKTHNNTWDFQFSGDMSEVFEYYNTLIKAKKELVLAGQDDEPLLDTKVYSDLNDVINSMSESMDTYIKRRYEEEKLVYMSKNGIPATTEEYRNMEMALIDTAGASEALQDKFKEMLMTDFSDLAADVQNVGMAVGDAIDRLKNTPDFSTQLTTSAEALDKFQSSVKSAYDAYGTLMSGNYSSSDLLDSIQEINQAATDMGKSINWEFIEGMDARGVYDSMELLGGAIEYISEEYAKSVLSGMGVDVNSKFGQMLADTIIQAQKAQAEFGAMNSQIDRLQSSYQTLTGILDSYNETGYFSLDNLQAILTVDENLIAMLQIENGQLVINQTAYENLVAAQLMEFKAKLNDAAAAEIEALAKAKAEEATNKNADASNNAVEKLDAETNAFHRNTSAAIANAVAKAEEAGVTEEEIDNILDKYNEIWDSAVDGFKNDFPSTMANSAKSAAKETQKEVDIMAELNSEMDKLQSAYKSLCDIRDTYNQYGKITVDQYQELTDMGFNFLANLIDENGQLGLNANAFEQLANAKLQEMQIQLARNAIDTINGLKTETEATEYLTYANKNLRDAALSSTEAMLYQAQAMAHLRGEQQGLAADQIVQGYEASKQLVGKVEFGFDPSEMEKAAQDAKQAFMDAYNEGKKLLDHMKAMGEISNSEYYERLMKLAEKYFNGKDEYRDNLWEVQEQYHDYLESIKKTYNWIENLLSALSKKTNALIDKVSKFVSWQRKNSMINRAVKASDNEITQNRSAYQLYMAKANGVGLSRSYIKKIQEGSLTIEELSNEALSEKIEKYQEWYDKAQNVLGTINDLYDKQRDLIRQKLENVLDYYSDMDSYLSSVTSKMESLISLNDEMGKRSSLTELVEQFSKLSDQIESVKTQIVGGVTVTEGSLGDSQKVAEAVKNDRQKAADAVNAEIENLDVTKSGTYTKLMSNIAKTEAQIEKYEDKGWDIKKAKQYDKLQAKLKDYYKLQHELDQYATSNTIANYSKVYTAYLKLQNKLYNGKTLSKSEQRKYDSYTAQIESLREQGASVLDKLYGELAQADGSAEKESEAEKIQGKIDSIQSDLENTATYQNLKRNIENTEEDLAELDGKGYDNLTKKQKKTYDKLQAQLEAYYAKKESLDENATASNIAEYNKIYDAWRKLQDKIDKGGNLSAAQWKNYNKYTEQLESYADEKAGTISKLEDELAAALNPGDKIEQIERAYEESAKDLYDSYHKQIDDINSDVTSTKQYQNLFAKAQKLEQKKDTKGLSVNEQATLDKYNAELEALRTGGMSTNIADYMKTWEALYKLQQKLDGGNTLTATQAKNYDTYKAKLEAWNNEKQSQINDLLDLMEDDLEQLQKTYTENVSEAEAEVNDYYANLYSLAKQIAEYNLTSLQTQLTYLESCISYCKELVSLYDSFSGDKLAKILKDLGEVDSENEILSRIDLYGNYLNKLQEKYDTTLSEMNEYRQLLDSLDTDDFESSMELFDKALESYKESGDTAMAEKLQAVLDLLNERAIDADNWGEFADEWANEWSEAFNTAKQELIGTATEIQEVNDVLREISFENITNAIDELEKASGILSSIESLINDDWIFEPDGSLSEYGRAKAALLVSQLEDAQSMANEYLELYNEIQNNQDTYASDKAYKTALNEALQNYYDSLGNAASLENSILELMKKNSEEEIKSLKDIIEARKKALQAKKDYYDYDKSIKNSQKEIDSLKAQRDAIKNLSDATDAATKAKLARLDAEIAEKEEALKETKDEHTFNLQIDALDKFADSLTEALDESTKSVAEIIKEEQKVMESVGEMCENAADSIKETIDKLASFYGGMGTTIDGTDLVPDINTGNNTDNTAGNITDTDVLSSPVAGNTRTEAVDKFISEASEAFKNGVLVRVSESQLLKVFDQNMLDFMRENVPPVVNAVQPIPDYIDYVREMETEPNINIHYDNMINVEGNVDKEVAKLLPAQLEQAFDYVTDKLYWNRRVLGAKPVRR